MTMKKFLAGIVSLSLLIAVVAPFAAVADSPAVGSLNLNASAVSNESLQQIQQGAAQYQTVANGGIATPSNLTTQPLSQTLTQAIEAQNVASGGLNLGTDSLTGQLSSCGNTSTSGSLSQITGSASATACPAGTTAVSGIAGACSDTAGNISFPNITVTAPTSPLLTSPSPTANLSVTSSGLVQGCPAGKIPEPGLTAGSVTCISAPGGNLSVQVPTLTGGTGSTQNTALNQAAQQLGNTLRQGTNTLATNAINTQLYQLAGGGTTGAVVVGLLNGASFGGITSSLVGGGQVGQLVGTATNIIGKSLLGSTGLGNVVSGTLSKLTGGLLGSATGGALGSILGGVPLVGSLLGGGAIPVSDSKVQSYTQKVQNDQDTQLQVLCNTQVMIEKAKQQLTAQIAQQTINQINTGNNGGSYYGATPAQLRAQTNSTLLQDTVNNVLPKVVNSAYLSDVQNGLANANTYDNDLAQQLYCPVANPQACLKDITQCGSTPQDQINALMQIRLHPGCTSLQASAVVSDYFDQRVALANHDVEQLYLQGQGYQPQVVCTDGTTNQAACIVTGNYKIVTPGSVLSAQNNQAIQTGFQQLQGANALGSLPDQLFAQLGTVALSSLNGLLSSAFSSANSALLNSVDSNTQAAAVVQAQNVLLSQIQSSLSTEQQYGQLIVNELSNLGSAEETYFSIEACYKPFMTTPSATIDVTTATNAYTTASTTDTTVISPQIDNLNQSFTSAQSVYNYLNSLLTQLQSASTLSQVNAVSANYNSLISNHLLHTYSDIQTLQSDSTNLQGLLSGLMQDANTSLQACQGPVPVS